MTTSLPSPDFLLLQLRLKGFWQQRGLGQHFLTDTGVLERIADAAGCDERTLAVEIGPGPGTLTTLLAARAGGVLAIEYDERLRPLHEEMFGDTGRVDFIYTDALKTDLVAEAETARGRRGLDRVILAGNLPFQITSPLMYAQARPDVSWRRMALMVQREVADRIAAPPACKEYGAMTVKLAYWWRIDERFEVPASQFFPRPKVDASVMTFEPLEAAMFPSPEEWAGLSRFIDAAFSQRRKKLVNSLSDSWKKFSSREETVAALERLGISPMARTETLAPPLLRELYHELIGH